MRKWDMAAALVLAALMPAVAVMSRSTQPFVQPVSVSGVVLLVVCGLALMAAQPYPVLAYVVAVGAAVAYLALRFAGWPVYLGAVAGLLVLVSRVDRVRRWVPFAVAGGAGITVATGPAEGWNPVPMVVVGVVWTVLALLAARHAQIRRRLLAEQAAGRAAEERLRLARELHDVLSHSLATISLQAGVGLHLVDRRPEQAGDALDAIRELSADALRQARETLGGVRDTQPAPAPGLGDLDRLVSSVRSAGVGVELDRDGLDGDVTVPGPTGAIAYRVVQEALTNVMRHAGPGAQARARLGRRDGWLEIEVVDDGPGISPESGQRPGHGLRGMGERVEAAGGALRAGPAPEGGFGLHARLPLTVRGRPC